MKKLIKLLQDEGFTLDLKNHTRSVLFFAIRDIIRDIERIRRDEK